MQSPQLPALVMALVLVAVPPARSEDPDLAALYAGGLSFGEFLAGVEKRGDEWREVYGGAEVPQDLLQRTQDLPGRWRLLVVAADWCGDSVHTVPYLARLAEQSRNLELAIVDRLEGHALMQARRTPDGRAATPTVVLLDAALSDVGCWVERPSQLQEWVLANEGALERDELVERKYDWYRADRGRGTLDELVAGLEAAAAGSPRCPGRTSGDVTR